VAPVCCEDHGEPFNFSPSLGIVAVPPYLWPALVSSRFTGKPLPVSSLDSRHHVGRFGVGDRVVGAGWIVASDVRRRVCPWRHRLLVACGGEAVWGCPLLDARFNDRDWVWSCED
jgi:hypothetical protein